MSDFHTPKSIGVLGNNPVLWRRTKTGTLGNPTSCLARHLPLAVLLPKYVRVPFSATALGSTDMVHVDYSEGLVSIETDRGKFKPKFPGRAFLTR